MNSTTNPTCNCNPSEQQTPPASESVTRKSFKQAGSLLLSLLIAFFPKCPVCLAAYMSMFGSFSLVDAPYLSWFFPLLIGFLLLHLFLLLKKAKQKGYGPFLLSLGGALIILLARNLFNHNKTILIVGMLFILSGSLWNSFNFKRTSLFNSK